MGFVPFDNRTMELTARYLYDGQQVENVFHVRSSTVAGITEMTAAAAAYKSWWTDHGKPISPTTLALQSILVKTLSTPIDPGIEYTTGLPEAGTSSGAQLPNNATLAVKWITAFRGRSYRGRTYHLGLMETQVVGNTVDPGALGIIKAVYQGLLDGLTAAGIPLVVGSKIGAKVERFVGLSTPVVALQIDPIVDSQRRRLPGRGA